MPTGDGRVLSPGGITSRDLPSPLLWQRETGNGHVGSVVVGRIETLEFHQDMVTATGTLLESAEWSTDVIEQLDAGVIGPSVDLDDMTYVVDDSERVIITSARIAGATLVAIPAFADVNITLDPVPAPDVSRETSPMEPEWEPSGLYALTAAAAQSAHFTPPADWFTRPADVGPLTVDGSRVFGYIGTWGTCHIGLPGCTTMPHSATKLSHFLRKDVITEDGSSVRTGVLTVGGGHADPALGLVPALSHYDDVGAAVAKVYAEEDEYGIWVSGYVLPYADPDKVQQLADLDVSGDWRKAGGNLELVAVCAVNAPGFPVLRKVHFSLESGGQTTLIGQFGVDVSRETSTEVPSFQPRIASPDAATARAEWARFEWARMV
jgi:hypothetical protein